ncbi:MAG: hypothetical protein N2260_07570 [Syntrophobacterales bacterium]|nr:hypothetical protein [Syntrophobacterales bacterium]
MEHGDKFEEIIDEFNKLPIISGKLREERKLMSCGDIGFISTKESEEDAKYTVNWVRFIIGFYERLVEL